MKKVSNRGDGRDPTLRTTPKIWCCFETIMWCQVASLETIHFFFETLSWDFTKTSQSAASVSFPCLIISFLVGRKFWGTNLCVEKYFFLPGRAANIFLLSLINFSKVYLCSAVGKLRRAKGKKFPLPGLVIQMLILLHLYHTHLQHHLHPASSLTSSSSMSLSSPVNPIQFPLWTQCQRTQESPGGHTADTRWASYPGGSITY